MSQVKSNIDSGAPQAIQWAGIEALEGPQSCLEEIRLIYQKRRDLMVEGLHRIGLPVNPPRASFYLWVEVPKGYTSAETTLHLLQQAGIVTTPGTGSGNRGKGISVFP